jgi:hypothetical protein
MRGLRLHVDYGHRDDPNLPALRLFADVMLDAVDLVQGVRHANATLPSKQADVAAARTWIRNGNVGALTFNEACSYLGWDAEHVRRAILAGCAQRLTHHHRVAGHTAKTAAANSARPT